MELHLAIKKIVALSGTDVLKEQRLINILSDFSSFEQYPSSKFILKNILEEGIMEQFLSIGSWDNTTDKLMNRFITTTGFTPDVTQYIFKSIAYGVGWLSVAPSISVANSSTGTVPNPTSSVKPTPGKKMSKEDMFEYLLSIVEIDPSFQSVTGLTVKSVSFDIDDSKEFTVICEITGTLSVTRFDLTIGIYDNNGRVRKKECYSVYNHRFKNYDMVSIYVDSPITIANISKVRVFVTDISY